LYRKLFSVRELYAFRKVVFLCVNRLFEWIICVTWKAIMPRVIIWSECQYTKLALETLILKLPFHVDVLTLPQNKNSITFDSSDYFILDPADKSFSRCYEFLLQHHERMDDNRMIFYSESLDATIMSTLLKRGIRSFSKNNSLQETSNLITKFILLKDISDLCDQHFLLITKMEIKILSMLVSGVSIRDISMILKRSIKTVSAHKCNLFKKIGITNNQELFFLFNHSVADMTAL